MVRTAPVFSLAVISEEMVIHQMPGMGKSSFGVKKAYKELWQKHIVGTINGNFLHVMVIFDIMGQLSKPKLNHQLNSTEFEVDNCPASKKGPSVQAYSYTQTSEATLYHVFAAEL